MQQRVVGQTRIGADCSLAIWHMVACSPTELNQDPQSNNFEQNAAEIYKIQAHS